MIWKWKVVVMRILKMKVMTMNNPTVQEPNVLDQSRRVKHLAALFKKTFSEPLPKAKVVTSNTVG